MINTDIRFKKRKFQSSDMMATSVDINQKICLERVLETQPQIARICSTIDQSILAIL